MNVFELRDRLVGDYASYTRSFIKIADPRIDAEVERALDRGALWPEPLLQLQAHERVRQATRARGRIAIYPVLPVDVLGAYVLLPILRGGKL